MTPSSPGFARRMLPDTDLVYVVEALGLTGESLADLRESLAADESRRAEVIGDERLFERVMASDDTFMRITPRLFFEVLLRRALQDLAHAAHVLERSGRDRVPLFLSEDEVRIVSRPIVIDYLADMLTSFTKVHSHTARVRVRRGVWRKSRYSDLDVPSLLRLASESDDADRLRVFKRAADACLLILGIFPDFAATATRYPGTGALRRRGARLSTEDYEAIAAKVYRAAAEHPAAPQSLARPMLLLSENVIDAKRPLTFMADHYLRFHRDDLFGFAA